MDREMGVCPVVRGVTGCLSVVKSLVVVCRGVSLTMAKMLCQYEYAQHFHEDKVLAD